MFIAVVMGILPVIASCAAVDHATFARRSSTLVFKSSSETGTGRSNRKPCTCEHPAARRSSNCSAVSTPSPVVSSCRLRPSPATAQTIAAQSARLENSATNDLSILILSNGKMRS
jgi:hypothetical protein